MEHDVARAPAEAAAHAAPPRTLPDDLRAQLERSYAADLSSVRILEDGTAELLGKVAAAHGADIHVARGQVDATTPRGRHVIAHEVAHVVQQGVVETRGSVEPADPHVSLEDEADTAARAALYNQPAKLSRGRASIGFHGFGSDEHKQAGDAGDVRFTGDPREYDFIGLPLTKGDLDLLAQDYFDAGPDALPQDSLWLHLHIVSLAPGKLVGSQDEIMCALKMALPHDVRWQHVESSDDVQTAVRQRYLRRANTNWDHFAHPSKHWAADDHGCAGGSYRICHEAALWTAYLEGTLEQAQLDESRADILEAGAQHYLTDGFAAGHVRTPRYDLRTWWGSLYPDFADNLVHVLAARMAEGLSHDHMLLARPVLHLEQEIVFRNVRTRLLDAFGVAGVPNFGDIVSLLLHDEDNEVGLWAKNDAGWAWRIYGDGTFANHPEQIKAVETAVELSQVDFETARVHGRLFPGNTREELLAHIRSRTRAPARPRDDKYGAEQLMPQLIPATNGDQSWAVQDFYTLLPIPIRSDRPARTYFMALLGACQPGGTIYDQFDGFRAVIPKDAYEIYSPRQAFEQTVLYPLANNPIWMIKSIIDKYAWTTP